MNAIIANLERAGLVQRSPHAVHGRVLKVELTLGGQMLLAECRSRVVAIEREIVRDLTPEETTGSGAGSASSRSRAGQVILVARPVSLIDGSLSA